MVVAIRRSDSDMMMRAGQLNGRSGLTLRLVTRPGRGELQTGAALWAQFTPHYAPKHGSRLPSAEIEASLWFRECHGRDRVDGFDALRDRTRVLKCARRWGEAKDHLAVHYRQRAACLPLQTAEHDAAVEALAAGGRP